MLLLREEFKNQVFARDKQKCVVCGDTAVDAHHLIDRSLWKDGGYYIDNGVSLCGKCHLDAEHSVYSVAYLREKANITNIVLPNDFSLNITYDKWGNDVNSEEYINNHWYKKFKK